MQMKRAYSTFEVKAVNEEEGVIEGWATTPTPDRLGDIVEPDGAQFKLPIPLLWQHNSGQPIGHVTSAEVSDQGIYVKAKFARIKEPGALKNRLDEAWQSLKAGLVRGLSIGFRPIEEAWMKDSNAYRFTSWEWLELSAVTIPANADATIEMIKSIDREVLSTASGAKGADGGEADPRKPGASGKPVSVKVSKKMAKKSNSERIAEFEATRAAKAAEMQEILDVADKRGETLDESEQERFDAVQTEIKAIDSHLKRMRDAEALALETAKAVTPEDGRDPEKASAARTTVPAMSGVRSKGNAPPGMGYARLVKALAATRFDKRDALIYAQNQPWSSTPEVVACLKTAVTGGTSTTAGWASEIAYAQDLANEFIEYLRPMTIVGRLPGLRRVPFNVRMGSATGGTTGYWVGQGAGIPVSKMTTSSTSLGITKAAGLVVITEELARLSSPSAEALVRDDLAGAVRDVVDVQFISPNQGGSTNVSPQSVTYGVTPTSASGTDYAALKTDIKALFSAWITANVDASGAAFVMSPSIALALSLMQNALGQREFPSMTIDGGVFFGLPAITSQSTVISGSPDWGNMIILIKQSDIFLADDGGLSVDASREAAIEMSDGPSQTAASGTGASLTSMWQTESVALKVVRYINWTKRRSTAVQFIRNAAYV